MDSATAVRVWGALEKLRYLFDDEAFPKFDVRLDATSNANEDRVFRLFVRRCSGAPIGESEDDYRFVLDQAAEHDLSVLIENAGISLT